MKIEGSTFIVTGGISGLGGAVTERLLELGANVAAFDFNEQKGKEFQASHKKCLFFPCDVTKEASVKTAVQSAAKEMGNIRGLINCAGIGAPARVLGKGNEVDAKTIGMFRKVIDVNLIGSYICLAYAAAEITKQELLEGERGVIVNCASVAAFDGQIGQASYSASKGGVAAMTLPLARDLSRHAIRVNTIAPGIFRTPMTDSFPAKLAESLNRQVPFPNRMGDPSEFASLVVELIQNKYFNAETIRLDGGIRMSAL